MKIYEFSRSYPDASGWLNSCVEAYCADTAEELEKSIYIAIIKKNAKRYLSECVELLRQGLAVCAEADGPGAYEGALRLDIQMIEGFLKLQTYAEMNRAMGHVKWEKLAANRDKNVAEEKVSQVKAIREEVKTLVKDMSSQYFYQDMEGILTDIRLCRPQVNVLVGLVEEFAGRFEEKKQEKELIDFSDMEQYALRILTKREGDLLFRFI